MERGWRGGLNNCMSKFLLHCLHKQYCLPAENCKTCLVADLDDLYDPCSSEELLPLDNLNISDRTHVIKNNTTKAFKDKYLKFGKRVVGFEIVKRLLLSICRPKRLAGAAKRLQLKS